MKIVLFDYIFERDKPGMTGLSDIVWSWAKHLLLYKDEVHIVAPYPDAAKPPQGAIVHRFPLPPLGYHNILGHLLIVLRGWAEIRKLGKVDVIQAPEYLSTAAFALLSRDTPVVLRVPGNIYERIARGNPFDWSVTQVLKVAARVSARLCSCIIVTTDEMRRWWGRTGAPEARMVLIPTGVDVQRFRPVPAARTALDIRPESRVVLYVGRLSREKGLFHLFEAVRDVSTQAPATELHVVGDGPLKDDLSELAKHLAIEDRVVFHGWVDQPSLPVYYSAADVTVLPSLTEGLPRTMLEAMACGCPFLGTKITGVVDHVKDGTTGFVVPPGDSSALANRLKAILSNRGLAREVGQKGRDYVVRELDWRVVVGRMHSDVYSTLVGRNVDG